MKIAKEAKLKTKRIQRRIVIAKPRERSSSKTIAACKDSDITIKERKTKHSGKNLEFKKDLKEDSKITRVIGNSTLEVEDLYSFQKQHCN